MMQLLDILIAFKMRASQQAFGFPDISGVPQNSGGRGQCLLKTVLLKEAWMSQQCFIIFLWELQHIMGMLLDYSLTYFR